VGAAAAATAPATGRAATGRRKTDVVRVGHGDRHLQPCSRAAAALWLEVLPCTGPGGAWHTPGGAFAWRVGRPGFAASPFHNRKLDDAPYRRALLDTAFLLLLDAAGAWGALRRSRPLSRFRS